MSEGSTNWTITCCEVLAMLNRVAMNLLYLFFSCFLIPFSFRVLLLMISINVRELRRYCTSILKLWLHFVPPYWKHLWGPYGSRHSYLLQTFLQWYLHILLLFKQFCICWVCQHYCHKNVSCGNQDMVRPQGIHHTWRKNRILF